LCAAICAASDSFSSAKRRWSASRASIACEPRSRVRRLRTTRQRSARQDGPARPMHRSTHRRPPPPHGRDAARNTACRRGREGSEYTRLGGASARPHLRELPLHLRLLLGEARPEALDLEAALVQRAYARERESALRPSGASSRARKRRPINAARAEASRPTLRHARQRATA
jgi:hypothetical protein